MAPRGPKMTPSCLQDGPKKPQDGPKRPQDDPKLSPRWPKMAPSGTKMTPRWPKMAPSGAKMAPGSLKTAPSQPFGLEWYRFHLCYTVMLASVKPTIVLLEKEKEKHRNFPLMFLAVRGTHEHLSFHVFSIAPSFFFSISTDAVRVVACLRLPSPGFAPPCWRRLQLV